MKKELIIIGAGAHARVVLEAVSMSDVYEVVGFCTDDLKVGTRVLDKYEVLDDVHLSSLPAKPDLHFVVAIGNNGARNTIFENACNKFLPATIIHPKSVVSPSALIGKGTVILSAACINSSALIGDNTIINVAALVDHDCRIGKSCHVSSATKVGAYSVISDQFTSSFSQIIMPHSRL